MSGCVPVLVTREVVLGAEVGLQVDVLYADASRDLAQVRREGTVARGRIALARYRHEDEAPARREASEEALHHLPFDGFRNAPPPVLVIARSVAVQRGNESSIDGIGREAVRMQPACPGNGQQERRERSPVRRMPLEAGIDVWPRTDGELEWHDVVGQVV